ncbi:MAG: hypothetical protein R3B99_34260 [Polyangiales bacterium]
MRRSLCLVWVVVASACASKPSLTVEVKTDAVSGVEFRSVETEVARADGRVVRSSLARATVDSDFADGVVVAELANLPKDVYRVTVRLIREDGTRVLLSRVRVISVEQTTRALFVLDRACFDRVCPDAGGGPGSTECAGGSCVDPRCVLPEGDLCDGVELCASDDDCAAPSAACARSRCVDGLCFAVAVDGGCGEDSWCQPESGCRPFEPEPVACGTECARTECEVSIWRCEGAVPTCEPYLRPSAGAACAAGVCDGIGRCGECPAGAACNSACRSGVIVCGDEGAECVLDGGDAPLDAPCADSGFCVEGEACAATGVCTASMGGVSCLPDVGPPRLVVEPTTLDVAEGETEVTSVRLSAEPTENVRVAFAVSSEATLSETEHVFGPGNWFVPHRIDVFGVVDGVVDGDQPHGLVLTSTSVEPAFDGLRVDVGGNVLDRAPRCGDGFVDATETCDDGASNGTGCGLCLSGCEGFAYANPPSERVFSDADPGSSFSNSGRVPGPGGESTSASWSVAVRNEPDEPRDGGAPSVSVSASKGRTDTAEMLYYRVVSNDSSFTFQRGVHCALEVSFRATLGEGAVEGAAGLRATLVQRGETAWVDAPRGTGDPGDPTYLETYLDRAPPYGPTVTGSWVFTADELVRAGFDERTAIYPGVIVVRALTAASESTVYLDDFELNVLYDRDRDGLCDTEDPAVCGNGVVEPGEGCDTGCRGVPASCVRCPI